MKLENYLTLRQFLRLTKPRISLSVVVKLCSLLYPLPLAVQGRSHKSVSQLCTSDHYLKFTPPSPNYRTATRFHYDNWTPHALPSLHSLPGHSSGASRAFKFARPSKYHQSSTNKHKYEKI